MGTVVEQWPLSVLLSINNVNKCNTCTYECGWPPIPISTVKCVILSTLFLSATTSLERNVSISQNCLYFLTLFRDLASPFQNEQKLCYMQQVPTSQYLILILHFIVFNPMRN